MTARILVVLALCACIVVPARAATIDPELLDAFAAQGPGSQLRVMVLFEDTVDLARLQTDVSGLAPMERRKQVVQTLKAHAAATQAGLRATIEASVGRDKTSRVRTLWTVNALALTADRELVETMAAAQPHARIVFDKRYDMISGVTAPPTRPADEGTADASKVDTIAWNVDWIHAPDVWNTLGYTGNGIVVAHVDSGVEQSHTDLVNRLWVNPGEIPGNQIDDDGNGFVDDIHGYDFANDDADPQDDAPTPNGGHGTHTGGTVAGDGTGGTHTGVAPGAQLMLCKVFPSSGDNASFADIWAAHQYAMENGARVITESLGVAGDEIPDPLMRSVRLDGDALRTAGLVLFSAAGNDHNIYDPPFEVGVPARVPAPWNSIPSLYTSLGGVVAVGGTGYKQNTVYNGSSQGPVNWSGITPWNDWPTLIKPDIAAPGVGVNSTVRTGGYSGDSWVGTSMACPHIAGVAALMLEKNPTLPPETIDEILETTALDLGDPGKDNAFGSGLVDAMAAVEAVPTVPWPHLVQSGLTMLDAGGDGIIDPGEDFEVAVDLTNNGLVDATTVSATLSVLANPYVSVTDAQGTFPTILSGGGTQSNAGDTFGLTADAASPQGFEFTIVVAIDTDGGYHKEFDSRLVVGLPDFADHDIGAVVLTVTDQGTLGYMGDDQVEGSGFGPAGGSSALFIGSFWAGNDLSYICNRDYSGIPASPERFEWRVVTNPNGRVQKLGAVKSDQDFRATYNDAGAGTLAKGIQVTQKSFAWVDAGYNQFVMILYTVTNNGGTTLADWFAGVFCDWDIGGDPGTNRGNTDFARQVSYIYDNSGKYAGVVYLGSDPVANLTMIDNETYVYPTSSIPDGTKVGFLKGRKSTFRVPQTTAPGDWSALTSVGPFDLAPGATVQVPFAIVYGTSLADFQTNVDRAQERWNDAGIVAIAPPPPGDLPAPVEHRLALAQNRPNPFNPSTTIFFSTERTGPVKLAVYDLAGRLIRTLVDREFEAGSWSATWDGSDDRGRTMPSGLYLARMETAHRVLSRKMMLVK